VTLKAWARLSEGRSAFDSWIQMGKQPGVQGTLRFTFGNKGKGQAPIFLAASGEGLHEAGESPGALTGFAVGEERP